MEYLIVGTLYILTLAYLIYNQKVNNEVEIQRFRELSRSIKSKNLEEYEQSLPSKEELPIIPHDEFMELDSVDPSVLLKAKKE